MIAAVTCISKTHSDLDLWPRSFFSNTDLYFQLLIQCIQLGNSEISIYSYKTPFPLYFFLGPCHFIALVSQTGNFGIIFDVFLTFTGQTQHVTNPHIFIYKMSPNPSPSLNPLTQTLAQIFTVPCSDRTMVLYFGSTHLFHSYTLIEIICKP